MSMTATLAAPAAVRQKHILVVDDEKNIRRLIEVNLARFGYRVSQAFDGQDALELTPTLPNNTYQRANYVTANLIWLPVDRMGVGIEYLYGFRKNKDGGRGENSRIQMGFQYRF